MIEPVRFRLEVLLVTGQTIVCDVTEADALKEAEGRTFQWPAGMTDEQKPMTVLFTVVEIGMRGGNGKSSVFTDVDGRVHAVGALGIVAFSILDRQVTAGRGLGFRPPVLATEEEGG